MRVVTYNIHGWRDQDGQPNLARVTRVLADLAPDVVGLNEVFHPDSREGEPSSLEALAQALDMHFVFGPCLRWPATQELPARSYGNALLSRWPILASAAHHLTGPPDKEQRGLLEARLHLPGDRPFTVYVTHLDHTDEAARVAQFRSLRAWTGRDRNRPHILMGDFNAISPWDFQDNPEALEEVARHPKVGHVAPPDGPQLIPLVEKAGYVDAYRLVGAPGQASVMLPGEEDAPALRIDYIWVSQPLAQHVTSAQIGRQPPAPEASDHWPVLVELDW